MSKTFTIGQLSDLHCGSPFFVPSLLDRAIYVERGTMANTQSVRLADKADDQAPYFSIVLVPGWAGRP